MTLQPNPSSLTAEDSPHFGSGSATDFLSPESYITTDGQSASLS
jgi:hypothetical protein